MIALELLLNVILVENVCNAYKITNVLMLRKINVIKLLEHVKVHVHKQTNQQSALGQQPIAI